MSERCSDCGQFTGTDHDCPRPEEPPACARPGCEKPRKSPRHSYCGGECYNQHRAEKAEARRDTCALEGCEGRVSLDAKKYCSPACAAEGKVGMYDTDPDTHPCPICGTETDNSKYCSTGCAAEGKRTPKDVEVEVGASQESYFIADGQVVFAVDNKMFRVPVDRWDAICRDYSEYGGNLTQAEVARKHGVPQPLIRRALRAYDQYKSSPPMRRERIAEADELQPLVQEAVENREYELLQKIERREERKVKREWREMKERLQEEERFVEAGRKVAANLDLPDLPDGPDAEPDHDTALAITTDEQLGRPTWGEGVWGEDYDSSIGGQRLIGEGVAGSRWVEAQGGVQTVYRAYNGDFFEGLTGETAHETPMDLDTRFERTWDIALRAVLQNARAWKRVCDKLVLLFVAGNHDRFDTHKFASTIRFALDADDVEVRATPKMYDAIRVGESLHVFDHGYRLSKLSGYKAQVDVQKVARKVGGDDYHGAEHIYYHVGHKHSRAVVTVGDHLEVIRHPALCEASEWEHEGRWVAKPCADVMLLDDKGRIDTPKRLYRDTLDAAGAEAVAGP